MLLGYSSASTRRIHVDRDSRLCLCISVDVQARGKPAKGVQRNENETTGYHGLNVGAFALFIFFTQGSRKYKNFGVSLIVYIYRYVDDGACMRKRHGSG